MKNYQGSLILHKAIGFVIVFCVAHLLFSCTENTKDEKNKAFDNRDCFKHFDIFSMKYHTLGDERTCVKVISKGKNLELITGERVTQFIWNEKDSSYTFEHDQFDDVSTVAVKCTGIVYVNKLLFIKKIFVGKEMGRLVIDVVSPSKILKYEIKATFFEKSIEKIKLLKHTDLLNMSERFYDIDYSFSKEEHCMLTHQKTLNLKYKEPVLSTGDAKIPISKLDSLGDFIFFRYVYGPGILN